eukprot:3183951-Amphidinium_carterae.1
MLQMKCALKGCVPGQTTDSERLPQLRTIRFNPGCGWLNQQTTAVATAGGPKGDNQGTVEMMVTMTSSAEGSVIA